MFTKLFNRRNAVSAAIGVAIAAVAFTAGCNAQQPHTVTTTVTVVRTQDDSNSFNDGWCTALYGDGHVASSATPAPSASPSCNGSH